MENELNFETLALHAGQDIESDTLSRGVPVYRTSSYVFKDTQHAADLFGLKTPGNIYTRIMNPTQDVLEKRVAALEGAPAALAFASGTTAIFNTVINICTTGDEIVSSKYLYGGTYTMFNDILPQFGIKTKFVDIIDSFAIEGVISEKTRLIYAETIGNPTLDFADIEKIGKIAEKYRLPLVVDATFTTPYLLRTLEHGANIAIHSLTKWLGGHGSGIGGIVVDGGKFDWTDKKFKLLNEPDSSYHNVRFAYDLGEQNHLAFINRLRLVPLRNLGACISPDNAWIFLQGIETLPLRMERHCENALKVAQYLANHPKVAWVRYPGLKEDPSYAVSSKYLKKGFGGMVVFGIKGGSAAGSKFIDNLKLFSHLANVGDAKSLAIHPASTTHSQLSAKEQLEGGITPDLIRLSIGIEHIDDIISDLEQALE
ncbi:MAG: O-acetylhomoserine aminocarboxypropyltransferase/cysteine synthase [Candidatus Margulisbacteria bacterium]|nr:O-acetylhomoserine aminocarboxypropyltransferase/cysteine synthase [Candidatus Margulisiibacteriota bacterium]